MKKVIIGILLAIIATIAGLGAAYGASRLIHRALPAVALQRGWGIPFGQKKGQHFNRRGYGQQWFCQPGRDRQWKFGPQSQEQKGFGYGRGWPGTAEQDKQRGFGMGSGAPWGGGMYPNGPEGFGMGPGMQGRYHWWGQQNNKDQQNQAGQQNQSPSGTVTPTRITLDKATQQVQSYASAYGQNFVPAEIMEFERNFYAVINEKDTGKPAFEVLVDPFTGAVSPEPGPNMMWNLKYGHMTNGTVQANKVTLDQARADAQTAVDKQMPNAKIEAGGYAFYGYYTFDYTVNGQIAGMISVNGLDGRVWLHTWHGQFIAEKELGK